MAWSVTIMECERGWGQRVDSIEYFSERDEAYEFVSQFNDSNDQPKAPDWYMYAERPYYISEFELIKRTAESK